jgi:sRNA-binding regulator protein Hfq
MPLLESKWPRRAFLVNKAGCVTRFDSFSLPLTREALSQLVYNHWIRTFAPTGPVRLVEEDVGSEPAARALPAEIKLRVMMPVRLAQAARFNGVARLTGAVHWEDGNLTLDNDEHVLECLANEELDDAA